MSKTEDFLKIVKENPNLRIIPMVYSEVVCDDSFGTWVGSFGSTYIDEICHPEDADRYYFKSEIEDLSEYFTDLYADSPKYAEMSDKEFWDAMDTKAQNQEWEKVIVVYIDLPEV